MDHIKGLMKGGWSEHAETCSQEGANHVPYLEYPQYHYVMGSLNKYKTWFCVGNSGGGSIQLPSVWCDNHSVWHNNHIIIHHIISTFSKFTCDFQAVSIKNLNTFSFPIK